MAMGLKLVCVEFFESVCKSMVFVVIRERLSCTFYVCGPGQEID